MTKITGVPVSTLIIAGVGLAISFSALSSPFLNDDIYQIVNSPPVHSISNIATFFQHGTFYLDNSLSGSYYRPMVTTVYSLLYTTFGPTPLAFHLLQLLLCVLNTIIL